MASVSLTASWKYGTVSEDAKLGRCAPWVLMSHKLAFIRKVYSILFVQIVSPNSLTRLSSTEVFGGLTLNSFNIGRYLYRERLFISKHQCDLLGPVSVRIIWPFTPTCAESLMTSASLPSAAYGYSTSPCLETSFPWASSTGSVITSPPISSSSRFSPSWKLSRLGWSSPSTRLLSSFKHYSSLLAYSSA